MPGPSWLQLAALWAAASRVETVGPHNCGAAIDPTGANGIPSDARPTDCAWRSVAVEFASQIAGSHVGPAVHDALEMGRLCPDGPARPLQVAKPYMLTQEMLGAEVVLHVSPCADGNGDGTEVKPLTLLQARDRIRSTA